MRSHPRILQVHLLMCCFALHAVSAGQIVPWALRLTSAGVLAPPEHGGRLTEAPQRHRERTIFVGGQVHDDSLAARHASAGGLQATRRRRGRRRLLAVHLAGARPRIVLGAERNERRGLRRLQRHTLQYIRPEGDTFPRDGTFPRQMMTCRPGLRWKSGLRSAFRSRSFYSP